MEFRFVKQSGRSPRNPTILQGTTMPLDLAFHVTNAPADFGALRRRNLQQDRRRDTDLPAKLEDRFIQGRCGLAQVKLGRQWRNAEPLRQQDTRLLHLDFKRIRLHSSALPSLLRLMEATSIAPEEAHSPG